MAGTNWGSIFPGRADLVQKTLFGSVLLKDYVSDNDFATYSPFDPASGRLSETILTTDGFTDLGYFDENGVEIDRNITSADTASWQSRQPLRTDITGDIEQIQFTCLESSPQVDALSNSLQLSAAGTLGASGYSVVRPKVTVVPYFQMIVLGVDGDSDDGQYVAKLYPRAGLVKIDKIQMQAKTEVQYQFTFQSYPDSTAGYAVKTLREGPKWRLLTDGS